MQLRGATNSLVKSGIFKNAQLRTRRAAAKRGSNILHIGDRVYYGRGGGQQRGIDIHDDVMRVVRTGTNRQKLMHVGQVDPLCRKVLLVLGKRGLHLTSFASELIVYDRASASGTAADIACLNTAGQLVLVELKTGYAGSIFTSAGHSPPQCFGRPFRDLTDSPLNRAYIQLVYTIALARRAYRLPVSESVHGYVVHAYTDTNSLQEHVKTYPLPENLLRRIPTLLAILGFFSGFIAFWYVLLQKRTSSDNLGYSFFMLLILSSMLGYLWFHLKYPVPGEGDTIKATYMLQIFPFIALLTGGVMERIRRISVFPYYSLLGALAIVFLHNINTMITHYSSIWVP